VKAKFSASVTSDWTIMWYCAVYIFLLFIVSAFLRINVIYILLCYHWSVTTLLCYHRSVTTLLYYHWSVTTLLYYHWSQKLAHRPMLCLATGRNVLNVYHMPNFALGVSFYVAYF